MITKTFKLLALTLILSVVAFSGFVALAYTDPQMTPPNCAPDEEGCNPPVNTGATGQVKSGNLIVGGTFGLFSNHAIEFASDLLSSAGEKAQWAGRIAYKTEYTMRNGVVRDLLNIVGGGKVEGDRLVQIWDNLDVVGTTTTTNLYANNYYVCTGTGNCSPFTGGGDSWTKVTGSTPGSIYYNKGVNGNVGIANNAPAALLDLGSNNYAGPAYLRVNSASGRAAGVRWADAGADIWYLYKSNLAGSGTKKDLILADGPNTTDTRVTFSNGPYVMNVNGSAKTLSLNSDVLVVGNSTGGVNTTGIALGNSPISEDSVLYITQATDAGGNRTIKLKPLSQVAGGGLWTKIAGENEIVTPYAVGLAGATNPSSGLSLAVGSNNTGIKYDAATGLLSFFNGIDRLNISSVGVVSIPETKPLMLGTGSATGLAGSLEIKGVGAAGSRKVTILDNLYTQNICTIGGVCSSVTNIINGGGASVWATSGANIYNSNSGNVGVGVTSPASKLAVAGYGTFSDGVGLKGDSLAANGKGLSFSLDETVNAPVTGKISLVGPLASWILPAGNTFNSNSLHLDGALNSASGQRYVTINDALYVKQSVYSNYIQGGTAVYGGKFCLPGNDCITAWPTGSGSGGVTSITAADSSVTITPAAGTGAVTIKANTGTGGGYWAASGNNIYSSNSGYVGIGKSSPETKLDVVGTITSDNTVTKGGGVVIMNSGLLSLMQTTSGVGSIQAFGGSLNLMGVGSSPNRKVTIFDQLCDSTGLCRSVSSIVSGTGGTGGVTSVTGSGAGISVAPTSGSVVIKNTGVTSIIAGNGISINGNSVGAVMIDAIPLSKIIKCHYSASGGVSAASAALGCTWSGISSIDASTLYCPTGYAATGGGVSCYEPGTGSPPTRYKIEESQALEGDVRGWVVNCDQHLGSASVVCAKI